MTHDPLHGHSKEKAAVEPWEKSIWWFLKVSDRGQNKVITTTNHRYFCSSYNFFVIVSGCPINIDFSHKILLPFLSIIQIL